MPPAHRLRVAPAVVLALVLTLGPAACRSGSTPSAGPTASPSTSADPAPQTTTAAPSNPSPAATAADPQVLPVAAPEWAEMVRTGVWHRGCPQSQATLRRVEVNYVGFDSQVHRGAIVVNADVAPAVARIFTKLFQARFPIRQMRPIEAFGGDNERSMAADNTAAYNCRRATQANSPAPLSPHANGRAIDLNPLHNPWVDPRCHCWSPSKRYAARRPAPGVVTKGGVAWRIFTAEGWIWQDIGTLDYMHFDTGYPSRPVSPSPTVT